MQRHLPTLTFLLAWCAISLWFYGSKMSVAPIGHHAWAMSDYYAMALRFQENGFDLFHPQTFNLRTKEGVTASDLPLPAWLSSIAMAITGNESAFWFRFLTWLVGFTGLFFFYQSLLNKGVTPWRSVVISLLFGLLPCSVFFHNSLLPTPWAFSAFLFGFWALTRVGIEGTANTRYFILAVAGFTLAALLRKPFVMYLLVVAVWLWQYHRSTRKTWTIWATGLFVFGAWQVYDQYLGLTYGSGFLRNLMPADSISEAVSLLKEAFEKWGMLWLSPAHWVWLALAIFATIILRWKKQTMSQPAGGFQWFLALTGLAGMTYCIGMLRQFSDHDYYGIDAFYPVLFVGVYAAAVAGKGHKYLLWVEIVLLLLALGFAKKGLDWCWDMSRFKDHGKTSLAYYGSRSLLDRLGIPADAKMLVFEAFSDNGPLIEMRRTGYCLNDSRPGPTAAAMQRPWDYVICVDTFLVSQMVNDNPTLIGQLQYVGDNGELTIMQRNPGSLPARLETLTGGVWQSVCDTSLAVPVSDEFLLSKTLPSTGGGKVMFYGYLSMNEPGELKATVALFKNGQNTAVIERVLAVGAAKTSTFRSTDVRIPDVPVDEMRVYLWNPQRRQVAFNNFRILFSGE